jgi:hypothetical protein
VDVILEKTELLPFLGLPAPVPAGPPPPTSIG